MTVPFWISKRYFRSMKRQRFLPLLTVVSICGVALGVASLVCVLSVMRGFNQELERKIMGFNAHVTITEKKSDQKLNEDLIRAILLDRYVKDAAPFVEGEAIAQSSTFGELAATGVKVRGIDPKSLGTLSEVEFYFPEGVAEFSELKSTKSKLPGVILGSEILPQLTVHPDFEDSVEIVAPLAEVGPTGELGPKMRKYRLIGTFRSGVFDYDSKLAFVSLAEAKKLLGVQKTSGWQITLEDSSKAPYIASLLRNNLDNGWIVESWDTQNKKLFAALKLERWAMGIILSLIVLIASFSIIGVIMMMVSGKRKDIATLQAIGMKASEAKRIFLFYSLYIGAIGSTIGGLIGTILCLILMRYPIRLPSSYYLDILPVDWSLFWSAFFILAGTLIAILASFYPVKQATAEAPIVTLRYE